MEREKQEDFPPAQIIDIPENIVYGICEDLFKRAREQGVFNKLDGKYIKNNDTKHPQVGVTAYKLGFTSNMVISQKIERNVQKYKCINNAKCPHSGQIYDSRSKCEVECPSGGLGCFTGRCIGIQCKSFITSNKIKLNFELKLVQSYGLKWNPKQSSSQECKDAIKSYEKALAIHEGKHIQDLKDIVKKTNDEWIGKKYYGCGRNDKEAMAEIKRQIKEDGEKMVNDKMKEYDTNYYPKVEQDYKISLDCRPCISNT
jgi:predicted metal-binding protein